MKKHTITIIIIIALFASLTITSCTGHKKATVSKANDTDCITTRQEFEQLINFVQCDTTTDDVLDKFVEFLDNSCISDSLRSAFWKVWHEKYEFKQRYEIILKPKKNESELMVELILGRKQYADCNHHSFYGDFFERLYLDTLCYEFKNIIELQTLMRCADRYKRKKEFVVWQSFGREQKENHIRYNSKSPIVIFIPDLFLGLEVKYRIRHREKIGRKRNATYKGAWVDCKSLQPKIKSVWNFQEKINK